MDFFSTNAANADLMFSAMVACHAGAIVVGLCPVRVADTTGIASISRWSVCPDRNASCYGCSCQDISWK